MKASGMQLMTARIHDTPQLVTKINTMSTTQITK